MSSEPIGNQHLLRVGDLARQTGKTVRAIHLYEELGLLAPATRSSGGFRLYDSNGARARSLDRSAARPRVSRSRRCASCSRAGGAPGSGRRRWRNCVRCSRASSRRRARPSCGISSSSANCRGARAISRPAGSARRRRPSRACASCEQDHGMEARAGAGGRHHYASRNRAPQHASGLRSRSRRSSRSAPRCRTMALPGTGHGKERQR